MRYSTRRSLRTLPEENFAKGGWFKNNWTDVAKTVAGGAMVATGVGAQGAGAGLMASGVGGMFTQDPEMADTNPQDTYAMLNRQASINGRGSNDPIFFRAGGVASKVPGGMLRQSASNAMIADGKDHEQGGIKIPGGEIEDDETIVQSPYTGKTQIHSDELGTSDVTNKLVKQKGNLESQLGELNTKLETLSAKRNEINDSFNKETNTIKRNAHRREFDNYSKQITDATESIANIQSQIENIDAQVEQVFNQQQDMNGNSTGETEFAMGGYPDNPPTQDQMFSRENTFDLYTFPGYFPNRGVSNVVNTNNDSQPISTNNTSIPAKSGKPATSTKSDKTTTANRNNDPISTISKSLEFSLDSENIGNPIKKDSSANFNIVGETPGMNIRSDIQDIFSKDNLGDTVNTFAPYLDNIFNAFANKRLSGMQTPKYNKASTPTIDPYYNINPQLENVQSQTASYKDFVKNNTNNSQVARAAISATNSDNRDTINQLYAEKDNRERATIAQNLNTGARVDAQNAQIQYRNDMTDYQAKVAGIERTSANVANMANKYIQQQSQENMLDYQMEALDAMLMGVEDGVSLDIKAAYNDGDLSTFMDALDKANIKGDRKAKLIETFNASNNEK